MAAPMCQTEQRVDTHTSLYDIQAPMDICEYEPISMAKMVSCNEKHRSAGVYSPLASSVSACFSI